MAELWAGIDAGKAHHHCVLIDAEGNRLLSRKVANDEAALTDLLTEVLALASGREILWDTDLNRGGTALPHRHASSPRPAPDLHPLKVRLLRCPHVPRRRENRRQRRSNRCRPGPDSARPPAHPKRRPNQHRPATTHIAPHRPGLRPKAVHHLRGSCTCWSTTSRLSPHPGTSGRKPLRSDAPGRVIQTNQPCVWRNTQYGAEQLIVRRYRAPPRRFHRWHFVIEGDGKSGG